MVTAVTAVAREHKPIWIAAAMTEGDRQRAADAQNAGEKLIEFGNPCEFRLRFVAPEPGGVPPVLQRHQQPIALVPPALFVGYAANARHHEGNLGRLARRLCGRQPAVRG